MTQDVDVIQQQIERLPWIKQASVRKQWPDELKIHLVEYVPVARWNDLHMVDAEGKAFSVPAERAGKQKLPLLYGPEGSEQDAGRLSGDERHVGGQQIYAENGGDDRAPFLAAGAGQRCPA